MKRRTAVVLAGVMLGALLIWMLTRKPRVMVAPPAPVALKANAPANTAATLASAKSTTALITGAPSSAGSASTQPPAQTFTPPSGEDRRARSFRRVETALNQKFLETAPVEAHQRARLIELLLRRRSLDAAAQKATIDAELRAMVGDEYFAEIERTSGRVDVPLYALEFIGEAVWRGAPLSLDQRTAFSRAIDTLDNSGKRYRKEPRSPGALSDYDAAVLNAAQSVLSPEQLQILEAVQRNGHADE